MADGARDQDVRFEVAERVLEGSNGPGEPEKPPRRESLRRAGRIFATSLPVVAIVALGAFNVSMLADDSHDAPISRSSGSMLPGRESLADAPGPDALGLRQRFVTHDAAPGSDGQSKDVTRNGRRTLQTTTAAGASFLAPSAMGVPPSPSGPTGGGQTGEGGPGPQQSSGGKKKPKPEPEPEAIPEPSAVMYRMWNSDRHDHYFTINEEEKDRLLNEGYRTYATEGIIFPTQEQGTFPIHTDDGIVGYAFGKQHENTVPLYFLRGPNGEGDLFTTSTETKDRWQLRNGWDYLGIVGYIGRWGPP